MLKADYTPVWTELDKQVFTQLVPADHYLRRLKAVVDFTRLRPLLADCCSAQMGRGCRRAGTFSVVSVGANFQTGA
jgi:hypothetical protein